MTDAKMTMQERSELQGNRVRFWMYWISSVLATLLFMLFLAMMLMVPGILPSAKMWMLSIAAVGLAVPLCIGVWKFGKRGTLAVLTLS